jgi:voltage-gated potassium channel
MRERPVAEEEIGRPLGSIETGLGLRVFRGSQSHGFWEGGCGCLEPGDTILEIVPTQAREVKS